MALEKILNEFLQFCVSLVQGIGAQFMALDFLFKLLVVGLFCLVMLLLLVFSRRGATAGQRGLVRAWRKLAKSGVAEWEMPLRLLSEREEWDTLPEEFRMELASRLIERDKVIDFILLVEDDEFDREFFVRLTNYEPDTAMQELAVMLTDHAAELEPKKAVTVLELAVQIDPENHMAMVDLATQHYAAKRFAEALPLLEQAISLSQHAMPRSRTKVDYLPGDEATEAHTLHDTLKLLGEMYEDCVERVGPKAA